MIDFFHKSASMTKRITGIAKIKGMPKVNPRPVRKIKKIGTFFDEEDKITSILLEVADDEDSRKAGLMGRESLPEICGMLFEGLSGGGNFWMKGCLIPLDVAFMTDEGFITKIYSMKLDERGMERYGYDDEDKMAVEVPSGFFNRHGILTGFKLETSDLSGGGKNV